MYRDEIINSSVITNNERRELTFTFDEYRELGGTAAESIEEDWPADVVKGKLEEYEKNAEHWDDLADKEPDGSGAAGGSRKVTFKLAAKTSRLLGDKLRLKTNQRVQSQEALDILQDVVENSDITRFERFKIWAKKNLGTLSVVAISVAGIVTSVVMGFRKTVVRGARATGKFAKALASVAAKVGPVAAAVLNLIGSVLKLGAKGVTSLSQILWFLAVAIALWLAQKFFPSLHSINGYRRNQSKRT